MAYFDMKVATFPSRYYRGNVGLWYCPHAHSYELRYSVELSQTGGICSTIAVASYSASDNAQVAALVLDAIDIARTPLMERG